MSINGINNPLGTLGTLGSLARPETTRAPQDRGAAGSAHPGTTPVDPRTVDPRALRAQAPIAGAGATQNAVPAEAPPGTDPTLWSVLTTEERNFFAKTAAMGPLTYGRIKSVTHPAPPVARGVRLDVRA